MFNEELRKCAAIVAKKMDKIAKEADKNYKVSYLSDDDVIVVEYKSKAVSTSISAITDIMLDVAAKAPEMAQYTDYELGVIAETLFDGAAEAIANAKECEDEDLSGLPFEERLEAFNKAIKEQGAVNCNLMFVDSIPFPSTEYYEKWNDLFVVVGVEKSNGDVGIAGPQLFKLFGLSGKEMYDYLRKKASEEASYNHLAEGALAVEYSDSRIPGGYPAIESGFISRYAKTLSSDLALLITKNGMIVLPFISERRRELEEFVRCALGVSNGAIGESFYVYERSTDSYRAVKIS